MQIRPLALRQELVQTLNAVDLQIEEVKREARRMGTEPHILRTTSGGWVMPPLLVAKAQLLCALVDINEKTK